MADRRENLRPAEVGNLLALRHGATSERQIRPQAARQKRRFLRQNGLRLGDLDGIGRGLLHNWSRAASALALMDAYAGEHGWLDGEGEPRGFARLYVSLLNSERLALRALDEHLRERVDLAPLALLEGEGRRVRLEAERRLDDEGAA